MAPPLFFTRLIRHGPRKIKSLHNGVFPTKLFRFVILGFLLSVFFLFFVFYTLQAAFSSTRSLAGDNLQPTPWHAFSRDQHLDSLSRTPKLFHCNYLTCRNPFRHTTPFSTYITHTNSSHRCPNFFRWIHEDLSHWRETGITQRMLQRAREFAAFRVVIVNGKLYTDLYYQCVQSRAMFTIWGLLMLLQRYPGKVPDVDFMFNCMDRPHFFKGKFSGDTAPPPLFAYCGTKDSFDIPFPDWSYWGWAEVNIGPWNEESVSIFDGSQEKSWSNREPRAYWKGNPHVGAQVRTDLLKCNKNETHDFGADILVQNWHAEAQEGYKNSKLSNQCHHRYKIYAEGHAWSVSFKYIMACGSTLLIVDPEYHDFFMRGLLPQEHYWPIDRNNICPAIKNVVEWGNSHSEKAEAIGSHGQEFLRKDLSMAHVYDYMLHLLQEYAKLQRFKPQVPEGAQEVCLDSILCIAEPLQSKYLEKSLLQQEPVMPPCWLPKADKSYMERFKEKEVRGFRAVHSMVENFTRSSSSLNPRETRKPTSKIVKPGLETMIPNKKQKKNKRKPSRNTKF